MSAPRRPDPEHVVDFLYGTNLLPASLALQEQPGILKEIMALRNENVGVELSAVCGSCRLSLRCIANRHPPLVCGHCRLILTRYAEMKTALGFENSRPEDVTFAEDHEGYGTEQHRVPTMCPLFMQSDLRCRRCAATEKRCVTEAYTHDQNGERTPLI